MLEQYTNLYLASIRTYTQTVRSSWLYDELPTQTHKIEEAALEKIRARGKKRKQVDFNIRSR